MKKGDRYNRIPAPPWGERSCHSTEILAARRRGFNQEQAGYELGKNVVERWPWSPCQGEKGEEKGDERSDRSER